MSMIDREKIVFANMMLGGGLPYLSRLLKASPKFAALKRRRVEVLAHRAEIRAKVDEIQRRMNEKIDALQREANAQIDALQAEADQRFEDLSRAAEELFSDAGLEDLFEALKEPEPAPAPPAGPAVVKPSSVHVLRSGDPPAKE